MTAQDVLLIIFSLLMLLFAATMVRHWIMMRWLNITLAAFAEQQKMFFELVETERERERNERPTTRNGFKP
jgi:hypothetical protein